MIIAFGHRSGVGKDTAAHLAASMLRTSGKHSTVQKVSFATPLKSSAHEIWGCYGLMAASFYDKEENLKLKDVPLPGIGRTPRQLWIELGMLVRGLHADSWIDALIHAARGAGVTLVADLRFTNEATKVHQAGGKVVRIDSLRGTDHASDHELKSWTSWDAIINNDGSRQDLYANVEALLRGWNLV